MRVISHLNVRHSMAVVSAFFYSFMYIYSSHRSSSEVVVILVGSRRRGDTLFLDETNILYMPQYTRAHDGSSQCNIHPNSA